MNNYIRHGISSLEDIVAAINANLQRPTGQKQRLNLHGFKVGVGSLRLLTFAKTYNDSGSVCCVGCGLKASFFSTDSFQSKSSRPSAHLNLYGVDAGGNEVLFTHDHILARGLGGDDELHNTQVMCSPCNSKKAKHESKLANMIHLSADKERIEIAPGRFIRRYDLNPEAIQKYIEEAEERKIRREAKRKLRYELWLAKGNVPFAKPNSVDNNKEDQ